MNCNAGALAYADRHALLFTREGLIITRPLIGGGATRMFCGCASPPPPWLKDKYGIDLDRFANETIDELRTAPPPAERRGTAYGRVAEAANALGYESEPLRKIVNPGRVQRFDCGAKSMLGCHRWAKVEQPRSVRPMRGRVPTS